jgi:hypothetical protein
MNTYSYSKLHTFDLCQAKYKFKYIDKPQVPNPIVGIETFMGDIVHYVLEKLYQPYCDYKLQDKIDAEKSAKGSITHTVFSEDSVQSQLPIDFSSTEALAELVKKERNTQELSLNDLFQIYQNRWNDEMNLLHKSGVKLFIAEGRDYLQYYNMGVDCLRNYYDKYQPFDQDVTLGVELHIDIDLHGDGKYMMGGIIDRLSTDGNGTYYIRDYKTYAKLPNLRKIKDISKQLEIYEFAVRELYPDCKKINLVWHLLLHDEEILISKDLRNKVDHDYLENLRAQFMKSIDRIEETVLEDNFPGNITKLCEWCEYKEICPFVNRKS